MNIFFLCKKSQNYQSVLQMEAGKQKERPHPSARNWHANGVGAQLQVSNYWIPVSRHPHDRSSLIREIGAHRTNQNLQYLRVN